MSHVGILSGGGPSQLFDLLALAREGKFFTRISPDAAAREAYVPACVDSILADPESADREFFGQHFRRWATFLTSSPMEELSGTRAEVFAAQGAADQVVSRASFDVLVAHLMSRGRRPTVRLVADADHSFMIREPGQAASVRLAGSDEGAPRLVHTG